MEKYYLGIDGGGSKTAFVVINEQKKIVYESIAGPSSLDTRPLQETRQLILAETHKIPFPICSIFAGIGGIVSIDDQKAVNEILKAIPVFNSNGIVNCDNDAMNALYGSLSGKDGIVLIAGTGSVAFGKYQGKYFRSGGYCYQEGDGGSSYALGRAALSYLARVLDKRKEGGLFADDLIKATACHTYASLVQYFLQADRTKIAQLAKVVTKNERDIHAKKIIEDGVQEVVEMIKAVYQTLQFDGLCLFSMIGSLGNADTLYKKKLLEEVRKIHPLIRYIPFEHEASYGAALKAKELFQLR